ncbi:MAG TPA: DUF6152 family protein [Steroidobacteraceae bacterium]|nr:DUF6152 family protein [Steroidobacteraceae bacterium]
MTRTVHAAGAVFLVALAAPALAHHSAAAFDRTKSVSMTGTVQEFKWTNPHTWITLAVPDGKGGEQQWVLEGPPLNMMVRTGWNGKTLVNGDKVRLLVAPYKDGSRRGEFMAVNKNGEYLKF